MAACTATDGVEREIERPSGPGAPGRENKVKLYSRSDSELIDVACLFTLRRAVCERDRGRPCPHKISLLSGLVRIASV
jgi:hypothetical protein